MGKVENVRVNLYINGKAAGQNLKGIRSETKKLRNELNQLTPGTEAFRKKANELKSVNKRLKIINDDVRGVGGAFGKIKQEVKAFGLVALGALGGAALLQGMDQIIQRNAKLSDSIADVMKTTGLTKKEVEDLNKEFKSLNTRSSRKELLGLAQIAGKLGITGKKNVLDFVKAADKINVALGEDLGGNAEEAIKQVGKLVELFGVSDDFNMEDSLLKVGSAINSLGAASTASEGYIVEFSKRLGGVSAAAGISIQDVMGLGASLDQLGQTSEVSTTVLTQLIIKMGEDIPRYAKIAKMSVADFSTMLRDDANGALLKVVENLASSGEGAEGMAKSLDKLGLDGTRAAGVINALANNTQLVREQQTLANAEFAKGSSLTDEFNVKNETLAGSLERVQKWMAGLFVNSAVSKGLSDIVGWMDRMVKVPVSETLEKERISLVSVESQLKNTNLKHADRVKLIKELKEKYPEYLGHLNAENVTNGQLTKSLKLVNEQLINKIILQKEDEKIEANNNSVAEKRIEIREQEGVLKNKVASLRKSGYNITLKEGTIMEQMLDVNQQLLKQDEGKFKNQGILFNKQVQFSHQVRILSEKTKTLNGLEDTGNRLMLAKSKILEDISAKEKTSIKYLTKLHGDGTETRWKITYDYLGKEIKRINITEKEKEDALAKELEAKIKTETTKTEETKEQIKAREKAEEDARKAKAAAEKKLANFITKQKEEVHLDQLTGYEREIAEIEIKYGKMIELARKHGFDSKAAELEGMMVAQTMQAMGDGILAEMEAMPDSEEDEEEAEANAEGEEWLLDAELEKLELTEGAKLALKAEYLQSDFNNFQKFLKNKEEAQGKHDDELAKKLRAFQMGANAVFGTMYAVNDAMMSQELNNAGDNEAKKAEITKKYARKRQTIAIGEALVQGALGIVKTGANMGYPAAIPFQIAQGIQTLAQVIMIKNQKFAKGGYTGFGLGFSDDTGKDVAGTVHANEYVIPETLLANPWVANVTRTMESMRTGQQGYADGGATTTTGDIETTDFEESSTADFGNNNLALQELIQIRQLLSKGVLAYYDDDEVRNIKELIDENDLVLRNATK